MRLLDLFCGAGGASRGYALAGFEVVGVDRVFQPNYPYEFHQADALSFDIDGFDAVHASPPCQHYSVASKSWNGRSEAWPDLIDPIRQRLLSTGLPFIIENVAGARSRLREPVMLCGTMFPGLRVIRHRYFECHGFDPPPRRPCGPHPLCYTRDRRKPHYGKLDEWTSFVSVNGGGNCSKASALDAMGISGEMTKQEVNEAIPPAYTEYLGEALRLGLSRSVSGAGGA